MGPCVIIAYLTHEPKLDREQAQRVLGRAAGLALREADRDLSLADLEAAAEEAGLDRALVRQAAAELSVERVRPPRRFVGGSRLLSSAGPHAATETRGPH